MICPKRVHAQLVGLDRAGDDSRNLTFNHAFIARRELVVPIQAAARAV